MLRFRFLQFLLLPALTATALLLTGALGQQSPPPSQPTSPPPPPPKADPAADKTVNQALEQLDPKRLGWLETVLWQQVHAQGLAFKAEGRYLSGPDHRLRLDLRVHLGGTDGVLHLVSDGATVWEEVRIGNGERFISKWDLKKAQEILNRPGSRPQDSEEFYRSQCFAGVLPLLLNIKNQMTFTKQEEGQWQKHNVFKLSAVWKSDDQRSVPPPNQWPPLVPRLCLLYLDKDAPHWPHRLEWLGPTSQGGPDSLLMEMEFRNPHFAPASSTPPQRYAREFTFAPGKEKVIDRNQQITEFVAKLQAQGQLRGQPQGSPLRGAPGPPPP